MIPNGVLLLRDEYTPLVSPESLKKTGLFDYELGGVQLGDVSEGHSRYTWKLTVESGTKLTLTREGIEPILVHTLSSKPIDVAFCFDQSMNPVLAWLTTDFEIFLRKFNFSTHVYEDISYGLGKCPRLTLDEKRKEFIPKSDIIFAYIQYNKLMYRVQREGFNVAHIVESDMLPSQRLARIGVNNFRLQMVLTPKG